MTHGGYIHAQTHYYNHGSRPSPELIEVGAALETGSLVMCATVVRQLSVDVKAGYQALLSNSRDVYHYTQY